MKSHERKTSFLVYSYKNVQNSKLLEIKKNYLKFLASKFQNISIENFKTS